MNEQLDRMRQEYQSVIPPAHLAGTVRKIIRRRKARKALTSAAGICAVAMILVFNMSPKLAAACADMPVLGAVVRVITFGRYEVHQDGFEADVEIPELTGLGDEELQAALNREFRDEAQALIRAYESDMAQLKETFPDETVHMGISSGYEVRTDSDRYLSVDIYVVNLVGSSSTTHKFYTIDKKTDRLVTLPSLFKEGADYVSVISDYLVEQMRAANRSGESQYWVDDDMAENFEKIKEDQSFFINEKGDLVICFDKYEVGPGSSGSPEFVIPHALIADFLA